MPPSGPGGGRRAVVRPEEVDLVATLETGPPTTVYSLVGGREVVIAALMAPAVRQFDHGVGLLDTRGVAQVLDVTDLFTGIVADERELEALRRGRHRRQG